MTATLERYRPLAEAFTARVEAVPDDRWENPSPCEGWTARDVVTHVIDNHRRLTAGVAGGEPEPVRPDDDVKAAWREAKEAALQLAADPEALQHQVPGPMGPMPVEMLLGRIMATDLLVHTWDLARAAGLDEQLDAESVRHAYEGLKPFDAMLRRPGMFGAKVEPPPGADLQTEFLCFVGRPV